MGQEGVNIVANGNEVKKNGQQSVADGWKCRSGPVIIRSSNNKTEESGRNSVANAQGSSVKKNQESATGG